MSDQSQNFCLRFDGSLTVSRARDVHSRLLDAIRTSPWVELDCSAAEEVDTTFLQLIVAASRSAQAMAKRFDVRAPAGGPLWEAVERSGLDPEELCLTTAAGRTEKGIS